jgi:hypothetical protein
MGGCATVASAPKKSDPTVPIIIVLAAVLALVLFGGNCNGIPQITWNGQNAGSPGNGGNGGPPRDHRGPPGDRGGPGPDRGVRHDRGCADRGPDGCGIREDRGGRRIEDRRHHCGCGPERDGSRHRGEHRHRHGHEVDRGADG